MTGRTMISNRCASRRRRHGPLLLSLLLSVAWLQALHVSTFVAPSRMPEQRVASGLSHHVFAEIDGHLSSNGSPVSRQRQRSPIVRTARGGGLLSWLRGRKNQNPEAETEAPSPAPAPKEEEEEEEAPAPAPAPKEEEVEEEAPAPAPAPKEEEKVEEEEAPTPAPAPEEEEKQEEELVTKAAAEAAAPAVAVAVGEAKAEAEVPTPAVAAAATETALEGATDDDADMLAAFQSFDLDGSGKIDKQEFTSVATRLGKSTEQIGTLLLLFSERGDNEIDFEDFKMIIQLEEQCNTETEECFKLDDPSTWGKLFDFEMPK